jgi:hypothetical protein
LNGLNGGAGEESLSDRAAVVVLVGLNMARYGAEAGTTFMLRRMTAPPARGGARGMVWPARAVTVGAGVLVASLWLQRVRPLSYEDFYGVYGGRLGIPRSIPEDRALDGLPGWFFPVSAAGQVLLACLAWRLAMVFRLRPDMVTSDEAFAVKAAGCASALVLWTLGTVVLYPGVLDPWVDQAGPFTRLAGTWVAAAAAFVTATALLVTAARARSAR